MEQEYSAGAVVYRKEGDIIYYVLLHYKYKSEYWDFARGNRETHETEEQTVKREVAEETGLNTFEFIPGFKERAKWVYRKDGKMVNKEVVYYLLKTDEKDVKPSHEHVGASWFTFEAAMKQMKFEQSKEVLEKADKFVKSIKTLSDFN